MRSEWDRLQPGRRRASRCRIEGVHAGLFPAEAGPTKKHCAYPMRLAATRNCRTGFSREGVGRRAAGWMVLTPGLFPAEAGPTKADCVHPVTLTEPELCGTGFSREGVGPHAAGLRVFTQASSRLKTVPLKSIARIRRDGLRPLYPRNKLQHLSEPPRRSSHTVAIPHARMTTHAYIKHSSQRRCFPICWRRSRPGIADD